MKPIPKPWRTSNISVFIKSKVADLVSIRITILRCSDNPKLKDLLCSYKESVILDKNYFIDSKGLNLEVSTELKEGFYCIQGFINPSRSFNKQYYIPFNVKQLVIGYKYSIYEPLTI